MFQGPAVFQGPPVHCMLLFYTTCGFQLTLSASLPVIGPIHPYALLSTVPMSNASGGGSCSSITQAQDLSYPGLSRSALAVPDARQCNLAEAE